MGPFWAQLQCVDCLAFGERWERGLLCLVFIEKQTLAVKRCLKQEGNRVATVLSKAVVDGTTQTLSKQLLYVKAKQALDLD